MSDADYSEEADFADKDRILADISHWLEVILGHPEHVRALEIGGAGGMLAGMFANKYGHVVCTDVVDWNSQYGGEFLKLVSEKFIRNGRQFDFARLEMLVANAENLCFRDNYFDVVFSLNALEHIANPLAALREVIRVTRPGGIIYLNFDPVWTADSGSHFLHRIGEPWAHLVKSDQEITSIMSQNGASTDEINSFMNHMNRLPAAFYRDNFPEVVKNCGSRIVQFNCWSGVCDDAFLEHENLKFAAQHLQTPIEDLLIRGFQFVIVKD